MAKFFSRLSTGRRIRNSKGVLNSKCLLNSKGFSLAELMVGMGVSMTISLIASFAFMMAFDVYIRSIRQYETEVEMSALMYGLRSSMVTASFVSYAGPGTAADNAVTQRPVPAAGAAYGRVYAVTDTNPATTYGGELQVVAQFNRERSSSNISGSLEAVQIVYQRPNIATLDSGAVYIDTERNPAVGGGWVRLSPVNAPQMYTRLTNFELNNIKVIDMKGRSVNNTPITGNVCLDAAGAAATCVGQQALSAEISMTMRYFVSGREREYKWCNRHRQGANAACIPVADQRYFDIDRKMTIVFSNNALEVGEYLPRRAFGNVYFFNPWTPPGGIQ